MEVKTLANEQLTVIFKSKIAYMSKLFLFSYIFETCGFLHRPVIDSTS